MIISNLIPDILALSLLAVCLFIAIRALYLYFYARSVRLFILGLSMGIIALTAAADFVSSHITSISLNTDWFLYIGQFLSFLFILLSLTHGSDSYLRRLMRWQISTFVLTSPLLFLMTILPQISDIATRTLLSGSRSLACFAIFFFYISAFMRKQTRFSLLMGVSFVLLSLGYWVIAQSYIISNPVLLDNVGDVFRLVGVATLLVAVTGK